MDLATAWAGTTGSVAARIDQLRARTVRRPVPISARAVLKFWTEAGVLARAWVVANDPARPFAERWHCKAAYDAIAGGAFADFDAADAGQLVRMRGYFARLKAAGPPDDPVLTEEEEVATLAMGFEVVREFTDAETDYPALHAAGLISDAEAGLEGG